MEKRRRPKVTEGIVYKAKTGCGNMYVTPAWDDKGHLIEVFATLGKAGGCEHCQLEAITRAVSLGLKYSIPIEEYVKELRGIGCPRSILVEGKKVLSCPDAIASTLEEDFSKHSSKE